MGALTLIVTVGTVGVPSSAVTWHLSPYATERACAAAEAELRIQAAMSQGLWEVIDAECVKA